MVGPAWLILVCLPHIYLVDRVLIIHLKNAFGGHLKIRITRSRLLGLVSKRRKPVDVAVMWADPRRGTRECLRRRQLSVVPEGRFSVIADPAKRAFPGQEDARFAMAGGQTFMRQ